MSRCAWPCGHCGAASLGPILAARVCRRCGRASPADRPPEKVAPVRLSPAAQWRGQLDAFAEALAREEQRLVIDIHRARERRLVELTRTFVEWRGRVARMHSDTVALLRASTSKVLKSSGEGDCDES